MNMSKLLQFLFLVLLAWAPLAAAAPDTYLGDTSIYAASATASSDNLPHVLFLIDTSRATLQKAVGSAYWDKGKPTDSDYPKPLPIYPNAGFDTWSIYVGDNQGNFTKLELANTGSDPTNRLENLQCKGVVDVALLAYGTYSGAGTETAPNLTGGQCATGPKGASYALGNYLNYLNRTPDATADVVRQNNYDCNITFTTTKNGKTTTQTTAVPDGCVATYTLTTSHITSSSNEPGVATSSWANYWTLNSSGCDPTKFTAGCNATAKPTPPMYTPPAGTVVWTVGVDLKVPPAQKTQRDLIYEAIAGAAGGAKKSVKMGAMYFNPNNQGGAVAYDIADLSNDDDVALNAFLASISAKDFTTFPIINSGPNRPQGEALYDAGYYFGVEYPTTAGTIVRTVDEKTNVVTLTVNGSTAIDKISTKVPTYTSTQLAAHRNPCQLNHIVLITNGLSNGDSNPAMENLVDSDGDKRPDESAYGEGSHYVDDIAAYLHLYGDVTVHSVLAFQAEDPLVRRVAENGGGEHFNVTSAEGLAGALLDILTGIVAETDTSFVAPVVPASSTNRTISSNRVYLGLFKPQTRLPWLGNLKKYGVNADLQLVDMIQPGETEGKLATEADGDFLTSSRSYWGEKNGYKMGEFGYITGTDSTTNLALGDGGVVPAGGVGGQLKIRLLDNLTNNPIADAAADAAADPATYQIRNIYTYLPGAEKDLTLADNRFITSNAKITAAVLAAADAKERDAIIKFVHGYDGYDTNTDERRYQLRSWILGDILHAKPLIFNYSSFNVNDPKEENDCYKNETMIYVGANDGMLHAFRDCDGGEEWAFIPPNLLTVLKDIHDKDHNYLSDGAATAYLHDINGNNIVETGDTVVLVFGQRRGGGRDTLSKDDPRGAYFALDVTDPKKPKFLWSLDSKTKITNTPSDDYSELGETWTQPRLAKVKIGTAGNTDKVVAFVGAGYDNNEDLRFGDRMKFPLDPLDPASELFDTTGPTFDGGNLNSANTTYNPTNPRGRGVYAIEVATLVYNTSTNLFAPDFTNGGHLLWKYTPTQNPDLTYSIPSDITPWDIDGDGFTDRLYVGDTGGRLWRFNVDNIDPGLWSGDIIFNANSSTSSWDTTKGRKFFYRPSLALISGVPTLYIGTGDREHPLNLGVVDRLYAIKDLDQTTSSAIDSSKLVNATVNRLQAADAESPEIDEILAKLKNLEYPSGSGVKWYGWFIDLEHTGEKNLSSPLVFSGQAFYTTYAPLPASALDTCELGNLGEARLYHLDAMTAEAVYNYNYGGSNDDPTAYAKNERAKGADGVALTKTYEGGVVKTDDRILSLGEGIPSGITVQLDASGKASLMISSSNRVGSYSAPDAKLITPLYWLQW